MDSIETLHQDSLDALRMQSSFHISYADIVLQNKDKILLYEQFPFLHTKSLTWTAKLAFMDFLRFCDKTDKNQIQKIKKLSEIGAKTGDYYEFIKRSHEYLRDYLKKNIDTLKIEKLDKVISSKEGWRNKIEDIEVRYLKKIEDKHTSGEKISLNDIVPISFDLQEDFCLGLWALGLDMDEIIKFIKITESAPKEKGPKLKNEISGVADGLYNTIIKPDIKSE